MSRQGLEKESVWGAFRAATAGAAGTEGTIRRAVRTVLTSGVAIGVLGIAGCNGLSTKLQVLQHLNLGVVNGQSFLEPGNYDAKLEVRNEKDATKIRLEINQGGKDRDLDPVIYIPLLPGQSLPTTSGELDIPAQQSGQQFDLHAVVSTDVTDSPEVWSTETCSKDGRITECSRDANGVRTCTTRTNTVIGSRDIRGYDHISHTDYSMTLNAPGAEKDQQILARAVAHDSSTQHVETFRGDCKVSGDLDVYIDHGGPVAPGPVVRPPGPPRDANGDTAQDNRDQLRERERRDEERRRQEGQPQPPPPGVHSVALE